MGTLCTAYSAASCARVYAAKSRGSLECNLHAAPMAPRGGDSALAKKAGRNEAPIL